MKRGRQTTPKPSASEQLRRTLEHLANIVEDGLLVVDRDYRVLFDDEFIALHDTSRLKRLLWVPLFN